MYYLKKQNPFDEFIYVWYRPFSIDTLKKAIIHQVPKYKNEQFLLGFNGLQKLKLKSISVLTIPNNL